MEIQTQQRGGSGVSSDLELRLRGASESPSTSDVTQ